MTVSCTKAAISWCWHLLHDSGSWSSFHLRIQSNPTVLRVSRSLSWKLTFRLSLFAFHLLQATLRSTPIPTVSRGINDTSYRYLFTTPSLPSNQQNLKDTVLILFFTLCGFNSLDGSITLFILDFFPVILVVDFGIDFDCVSLCLLTS